MNKIVQIGLLIGICLVIVLSCQKARAQEVIIKNKCSKWVYGDPAGWPCYNRTQGIGDADRIAIWEVYSEQFKHRKGFNKLKVYLVDPAHTPGEWNYRARVDGKKVYLAMSGCWWDRTQTRWALRRALGLRHK